MIIEKIRPMQSDERRMMPDFMYEAVFQKDESRPIPRSVINEPTVRIYHERFGSCADDLCLLALAEGQAVGAVWTRLLNGPIKGYGYVDDTTPELSISVLKPYRAQGIGSALIQAMLTLLCERGYTQVSLSVTKENPAVRLYKRLGFVIVKETDEDYIMTYTLANPPCISEQ